MPDFENLMGLLERMESRDIAVHQHRCVRVRNRNASCTRCADACTSGCLSYEDNELVVSPEKCIGCGTCSTACPTCALEAQRPSDAELLQECMQAVKHTAGTAIVACRQILEAAGDLCDRNKIVCVACLGRVEESLIADMAVRGVREVVLVRGKCARCEHEPGSVVVQQVCETANALMETWHQPLRVRVADRFPPLVRNGDDVEYDAQRRRFFGDVAHEVKSTAAVAADYAIEGQLGATAAVEPKYLKVAEDGTLPHFIPDRRERLLDDLAELGQPEDVMIETRLWGHVIIDLDKCTSCRMCATFCPTAALSKYKRKDGTFGVEHAPSDCVKCRCCEDICRAGAITISDEVFAVDLLKGIVETYEMKPLAHPVSEPQSILHSLKGLLGSDKVYER